MDKYPRRRDLEYGYPSLERGIEFSPESNCTYLEILHYTGSSGTAIHHSTEDLDDSSLDTWLLKVRMFRKLC